LSRSPTTALDRRDLREGGSWTALQRAKNDALWLVAAAALGATRHLPLPALRALGRASGAVAHWLGGSARRRALANVALALPELDDRARRALVRSCFRTLGEALGETVSLLRADRRPAPLHLSPGARATLDEARRDGRGVVFASAHLGPWEHVAASLVSAGVPLVTLARESYDPRFMALYERLRAASGVRVVWRSSPSAPLGIVRALRRGEVLGVPMDLRSRVPSIEVPFLGRHAPTAAGPATIALRAGAPVVVGTVAPRPSAPTETGPADPAPPPRRCRALEVTITRICAADLRPDPGGIAVLTARINDELSRRIRALPEAWVWMHERWPS
jgi:KDO2-lipid IV(A) lauroyltransferase